jgi:carbamoyl-phosphate synthase large subunit
MQIKILITGANGDLACSIAKILKNEFPNSRILGTDINKNGIGEEIFDHIYKTTYPDQKKYGSFIKKISKQIDLIIPTTETEINFFTKNINKFKAKILVNKKNIINLFNEKQKTQIFLKQNFTKLSLDYCFFLKDFNKNKKIVKFPSFLKKNIGSGNQNYQIIDSAKKIKNFKILNGKDWVIEQYLNKNYPEYTSAIIRLEKFEKICIFRRQLHKLGHTMYAETFQKIKIEKQLLEIAKKINLNGCINIQFKIINKKIKIFDINPRLSSSVRMRDIIGFHDCIWWIKNTLNINFSKKIKILKNKKIIKSFDEKIIN